MARDVARARDVLYLGRGGDFPLALEGALKLKEITYIHAEGYAAGEMKHGPIALIDYDMPVIVLAPPDATAGKDRLEHAGSRRARRPSHSHRRRRRARRRRRRARGLHRAARDERSFAPLVYAVPVQLLAYHVAVFMGNDVDQPRNLAKSVTVE